VEAAVLAKKTGQPVKVVWSREDDIKFDTYHSVAAMYMKAALDADGKPAAWLQRTVFLRSDPPSIPKQIIPPRTNWVSDSRMCLLLCRITASRMAPPPRTFESAGCAQWQIFITPLRCIPSLTNWPTRPGRDPVDYLLQLLGPDRVIPQSELPKDYSNYDGAYDQYPIDTARFRRVLSLATEKAGWGKQKSGNGFGMGVACIAAS